MMESRPLLRGVHAVIIMGMRRDVSLGRGPRRNDAVPDSPKPEAIT